MSAATQNRETTLIQKSFAMLVILVMLGCRKTKEESVEPLEQYRRYLGTGTGVVTGTLPDVPKPDASYSVVVYIFPVTRDTTQWYNNVVQKGKFSRPNGYSSAFQDNWMANPDDYGRFTFSNLVPGEYYVVAQTRSKYDLLPEPVRFLSYGKTTVESGTETRASLSRAPKEPWQE